MKGQDTGYKPVNTIEMVATVPPSATRWDKLLIIGLFLLLALTGWIQYSYMAQARMLRETIPQIVVTVTRGIGD